MRIGSANVIMSRRAALQGLTALAAGGVLNSIVSGQAFAEEAPESAGIRFGAQTNAWHVDPNSFDSLLAVLAQVRQVGYAGFETGFANVRQQFPRAAEARQRIASTGLVFFGVHIFLPAERYDPQTKIAPRSLYEEVARDGAALGARHLIFSSVPTSDAEDLLHKAAGLNAAGQFARKLGIALAYHNEKNNEGARELDALYAATDPEYVSFLLDAGHAYLAGIDVPAFLREHHRRIVGIHLRDFRDGKQVPLGQGTFPLAEAAAALKQVNWQGWALNEEEREDGTKAGLKFIEPAFQAMQRAFEA